MASLQMPQKSLLLRDGKRRTVSAKTRSWEKADAKAQEIRYAWDPVKQKERELDEREQAQLAQEVSIEEALERWLKSIYADIETKHTRKKYDTAAGKIRSWAKSRKVGVAFRNQD